MANLNNSVRIIGGKWRGRKIHFPSLDDLRPTHDRMRETLFNWLAPEIVDAICLDLFAGSGVIGFECISRGAKAVVMVDANYPVICSLQKHRKLLAADTVEIIQTAVPPATFKCSFDEFDIVFLDPPYHQGLINPSLAWLFQGNYVKRGTLIFVETEIELTQFVVPQKCEILKHKETATIAYYLLRVL